MRVAKFAMPPSQIHCCRRTPAKTELSRHDVGRFNLECQPAAFFTLRSLARGQGACKGIEDEIARIGQETNDRSSL
jgi:hypothetical protein